MYLKNNNCMPMHRNKIFYTQGHQLFFFFLSEGKNFSRQSLVLSADPTARTPRYKAAQANISFLL